MTETKADLYDGWRRLLAGEDVAVLAEKPMCGYFKTRRAPGPWLPVAIWHEPDIDDLIAMKGRREVPLGSVWPWCAANPITYEVYTDALENGFPDEAKPATRAEAADEIPGDEPVMDSPPLISTGEERISPDDVERVEDGIKPAIGHNSPPDEMAMTKEELEEAARLAEKMIAAGQAKSDEDEAAGNALIAKIMAAGKVVFEHRRNLKKPLEAEIKAIDALWMPLEKRADAVVSQLKRVVTGPYLQAKRDEETRKRQEEARLAREEAERKAKEAAAANSEDAAIAAEKARQQAQQAERQATAKSAVSSGGGTTKMKKVRVATVTDPAALAVFLLQRVPPNEEVLTILRQVANRMVAAGADKLVEIPGIEVTEETRFA